jgi:hypothetical protein
VPVLGVEQGEALIARVLMLESTSDMRELRPLLRKAN